MVEEVVVMDYFCTTYLSHSCPSGLKDWIFDWYNAHNKCYIH